MRGHHSRRSGQALLGAVVILSLAIPAAVAIWLNRVQAFERETLAGRFATQINALKFDLQKLVRDPDFVRESFFNKNPKMKRILEQGVGAWAQAGTSQDPEVRKRLLMQWLELSLKIVKPEDLQMTLGMPDGSTLGYGSGRAFPSLLPCTPDKNHPDNDPTCPLRVNVELKDMILSDPDVWVLEVSLKNTNVAATGTIPRDVMSFRVRIPLGHLALRMGPQSATCDGGHYHLLLSVGTPIRFGCGPVRAEAQHDPI